MHLPRAYGWVGIFLTLILLMILVFVSFLPRSKDDIPYWVVVLIFSIFILAGIELIMAGFLWRVHILKGEDYIIYRTIFGRTHKIQYSDITYYKIRLSSTKMKVGRKLYLIDTDMAVNVKFLYKAFREHKVSSI